MTDLQFLSKLKEKPFVTNCYMLENEIFDVDQSSYFDKQMNSDLVCLYKNTEYNFKQMYFFVSLVRLSKMEPCEWKENFFVVENVSQSKFIDKNTLITNWLSKSNVYHYRTFLRMYCLNSFDYNDIDFSIIENPKESDFQNIKEILELNFDIYAERIPSIGELRSLSKSTYIIKIENKIAAMLISAQKGKTEEIRYWLVDQNFRDKGFGGLLMKYFLNNNKDTKRYTLWVDNLNKNAINKYEFFGFVKDRIINSIYINRNIMIDKIINILIETRPEFDFNDETVSFMDAGYLDSFDIVTVVADLEEVFDVKISGASILPENFQSVESIVNLVENSKNAS